MLSSDPPLFAKLHRQIRLRLYAGDIHRILDSFRNAINGGSGVLLPIWQPVRPSASLSVCPFGSLHVRLPVCPSIRLSVRARLSSVSCRPRV